MGSLFLVAFLALQNPPATPVTPVNDGLSESAIPEPATPAQKPPETPPAQSPEAVLHPEETKRIPSTGEKIFTNFWFDQKAIWTSPLHIKKKDAKWWALFGGGTAVLIATDRHTSRALPNSLHQVAFSRNVSQIGAVYTTLPVAGALYLYGRQTDDPHAREAGVLGAQSLLDGYILATILKYGAGRERPDAAGGDGRFLKGGRSFPSGHAIMSWSFASLISHEYKGGKVVPTIAYSLASVVSVSRFTAQKHFASDIVAGGAMGWFIGKFVFEHHLDSAIHKRYDPTFHSRVPEVSPVFNPSTRTYALALAWER